MSVLAVLLWKRQTKKTWESSSKAALCNNPENTEPINIKWKPCKAFVNWKVTFHHFDQSVYRQPECSVAKQKEIRWLEFTRIVLIKPPPSHLKNEVLWKCLPPHILLGLPVCLFTEALVLLNVSHINMKASCRSTQCGKQIKCFWTSSSPQAFPLSLLDIFSSSDSLLPVSLFTGFSLSFSISLTLALSLPPPVVSFPSLPFHQSPRTRPFVLLQSHRLPLCSSPPLFLITLTLRLYKFCVTSLCSSSPYLIFHGTLPATRRRGGISVSSQTFTPRAKKRSDLGFWSRAVKFSSPPLIEGASRSSRQVVRGTKLACAVRYPGSHHRCQMIGGVIQRKGEISG